MRKSTWQHEPITQAQVKAIHTLRQQIMDEDTYRDLLRLRFGAASTLDLTKGQARSLLDHLNGKPLNPSTGGASIHQIGFLRHLLGQCGLAGERAVAYVQLRFVKRPIERLEDLNKREANQAIKGAKKWLAVLQRQNQPEATP